MFTVVLIIQIMVTIALVAVILLQRSEGGALGMGGGGGGGAGGLMTGRSAANLLTRTTTLLAAAFFITSIALTVIAKTQGDNRIEFGEDGVSAPAGSAPSVADLLGDDPLVPGDETIDAAPPAEAEVPVDDGPVVPDAD